MHDFVHFIFPRLNLKVNIRVRCVIIYGTLCIEGVYIGIAILVHRAYIFLMHKSFFDHVFFSHDFLLLERT